MASTNFVDFQTVIPAEWLNEVNTLVHTICNNATTAEEVRTAISAASIASVAEKADADSDAVEDNLAVFDSAGNPVDSGVALSGKADSTIGQGQHTLAVPAAAALPATDSAAAVGSLTTTTNKNTYSYLAFDADTDENAEFDVIMPKSWDGSTVIAQLHWSHESTTVNYDVKWNVSAVAIGNGDTLDVAMGTAQSVTDTGGSTDTMFISDETAAITVGGSPGSEETVRFRVTRDANDGADTLAVDARLHGIKIHYATNAATDD